MSLFLVWFGVSWCGLMWFVHFFGAIRCFMVWFECDLVVNNLLWFVRVWLGLSGFVFGVVWCLLVWLGVICIFFVLIDVLRCDLGVIWFWMIWSYFIEVWLDLRWFVFGVVWCLFVCFGVICTFFCAHRCFMVWFECDLFLNYLEWFYWGLVRS